MSITSIRVFICFIIGIAVCILLNYMAISGAKKNIDQNIYYIESPNDSSSFSSLKNAKNMKNINFLFSYESQSSLMLERDLTYKITTVICTISDYGLVNHLNFLYGGFWPEYFDDKQVIVLSKSVAWELFGNVDVVGLTVDIQKRKYEVVGVYQPPDNGDMAIIPIGSALANKKVKSLTFKSNEYSPIKSLNIIKQNFESLNVYTWEYTILDVQKELNIIAQRQNVMLLLGFTVFMLLIAEPFLRWSGTALKEKPIFVPAIILLCLYATAFIFILLIIISKLLSRELIDAFRILEYLQYSFMQDNFVMLKAYSGFSNKVFYAEIIILVINIAYAVFHLLKSKKNTKEQSRRLYEFNQ